MNKKADVNWFIVMAVLALAALLVMLIISSGVVTKFMNNMGWINKDLDIKTKCTPGPSDTDSDGDGYKASSANICINGKSIKCDSNDNDPKVNYEESGTCPKSN